MLNLLDEMGRCRSNKKYTRVRTGFQIYLFADSSQRRNRPPATSGQGSPTVPKVVNTDNHLASTTLHDRF